MTARTRRDNTSLDDFVGAYEAAQGQRGDAELADFLPPPDHPLYRTVLRELVRVDLEYGWQKGQPRPLSDYLQHFPDLSADRVALEEIAFEEYRLRCQAGEEVTPELYRSQLGIAAVDWPSEVNDNFRADPPHGRRLGHANGNGRAVEAAEVATELKDWGAAGLHADSLELLRGLEATDPDAAQIFAQALAALPAAESSFLDFRLVAELGRGAFGRVYLAHQGGLANRPVALKICIDVGGESQTLAQLQHTNIVPIYSVHRAGLFQAVCMPYFGPTTLAHLLQDIRAHGAVPDTGAELVALLRTRNARFPRQPQGRAQETTPSLKMLEGLSYTDAVLWIASQIAEGLDHAHEHGILHRDLKPANVLMTDEGQPMLVDFNLSRDAKAHVASARCGGTLAYMAPEHLEEFQGDSSGEHALDVRSDLYALGLIMYELLTGRYPFATTSGTSPEALAAMIAERRAGVTPIRRVTRTVSPAVAAIVGRLLETDPQRRYGSARQVCVDLQCQLAALPLHFTPEPSLRERAAKWLRRHPRVTSPSGVASMALAAAAAVVAIAFWLKLEEERAERGAFEAAQQRELAAAKEEAQEADKSLQQFRAALVSLRQGEDEVAEIRSLVDAGPFDQDNPADEIARCRAALARYGVLDNPRWREAPALRHLAAEERAQLQRDISELLFLIARSLLFDVGSGASAEADAKRKEAQGYSDQARACYDPGDEPPALLMQQARLANLAEQHEQAKALYKQAEGRAPRSAREAYLAAYEHAALGEFDSGVALCEQARSRDPRRPSNWILLGYCHFRVGNAAAAVRALNTGLDLQPGALAAVYHRGLSYLELKEWRLALADLTRIVEARPELVAGYFYRSAALRGLGQYQEAIADLTSALERNPGRAEFYFDRARLRQLVRDSAGAAEDDKAVLGIAPIDAQGWTCRGISALQLGRPQEALQCYQRAVQIDPQYTLALEEMAHVLATLPGRTEEALAAVDQALQQTPDSVSLHLSRGHLLALVNRRSDAQKEAGWCAARRPDAATQFQAACIYARTARTQVERTTALDLLAAALRQGYRRDDLLTLEPLAPLRQDPRFRQLVLAAWRLDPPTQ